jgi:hypothetical protein
VLIVKPHPPLLCVIIVVGSLRCRGQRAVDAIRAQSIAERLELVVIDTADPLVHPDLVLTGVARLVQIRVPEGTLWGVCRSQALQHATAPVVAFIEDHCFASPRWAEMLIEAFHHGHASVGYGFQNANPQTRTSRVGMLLDYGAWQLPTRSRVAERLPGNNVAYRKAAIDVFGPELSDLLEADYILQERLLAQGHSLYVAANAEVSHQNFDHLPATMAANFAYARLLAFHRYRSSHWSPLRRLVYTVGTPMVSAPMRLARLLGSFRFRADARHALWNCLQALPQILLLFAWASVGEALGYSIGVGRAREDLFHWEVEAERCRRSNAA